MSYVAIARKWRPRTFADIAGQSHVTRTLCNAIELGRVHHAFLFTGARGVGKTSAARVLARALNCDQGPTPSPCGECPSCSDIFAGSSPDVIEIDGASNNSVDDVRELRESVRYLPQRGRRKVYIVDEVHMLSKGAFNALLKTLEEPPAHVVFIFATTEPQKIPDTILSRVQRFDFKRIPETVVVETLRAICAAEDVEVAEAGLRLIARAGEGSMRDSQTLLDRVISFSGEAVTTEQVSEVLGLVDRSLLYEMLKGILVGEPDRCLDAIERVYTFGYDLSEFTAEMLELIRNATMVGLSPTSRRFLDVPEDEKARLEALTKDTSPDVFVQSFHVMLDVHEQVSRAPRPRLVLEMAVARLVSIRPARPLDQIVQQLNDLERRLRHGGVTARPRSPGGRGSGESPGRSADDADPAPPARGAPALSLVTGSPVTGAPVTGLGGAGPRASGPGGAGQGPRGAMAGSPGAAAARAPARPSLPAPMQPVPKPAAAPSDGAKAAIPPWRRGSSEGPKGVVAEPVTASAPQRTPPDSARNRWGPTEFPPVAPPENNAWDPPSTDGPPDDAWESPVRLVEQPAPVDPDDVAPAMPAQRPPPIPTDADHPARALALQVWLDRGHSGLLLLANYSVILPSAAPVLAVQMTGDFKSENALAWSQDPWVLSGMEICFPGFSRIQISRRPADSPHQTRDEVRRAARKSLLGRLQTEMEKDALVARIVEVLGGRLVGVVPADEQPPVLEKIG